MLANLKTKIEKHGLAPRVKALIDSGVTTGVGIAAALKADGWEITPHAVIRFLNKARDLTRPLSAEIFERHVQQELPKDLNALEDLERMCLGWAKEPITDIQARVAEAAVALPRETEKWRAITHDMASHDPDAVVEATKSAIKLVLAYLTRDARFQDKRIQAIQHAVKIIELKLRQAGVLEDDDKGRIVIMDRSSEYNAPVKDNQPSKSVPYLIKGAASNG